MALTQCNLDRTRRTSDISPRGDRTYTEEYIVRTDDVVDGPGVVLPLAQSVVRDATSAPVPALYATYTEYDGVTPVFSDSNCVCMNITSRQSTIPQKWAITATYRQMEDGEEPEDDVTDPLLLPNKYWVEFSDAYVTIDEARNQEVISQGQTWERAVDTLGPIVDGAGQTFDEDLQDIKRRIFLVAQKPFATVDDILTLHRTFEGTYNDDTTVGAIPSTFYGYPARQARYAGVNSSRQMIMNNIRYYLGTIRVEVSDETFDHRPPNRGWQYRTTAGVEELITWNGNAPINLSRDGVKVPDGNSERFPITYAFLNEADYTGLGI